MPKLIYQPKGKAREYSPWACNLYNGCSNRCEYCYNRHGIAAPLLGRDTPILKAGATVEQFKIELQKYKERIIEDGKGLFFNFVSDPFLEDTFELNMECAKIALREKVPCVFLSKCRVPMQMISMFMKHIHKVKVGFTLTGFDEVEPGADSNAQRIAEINALHTCGISTWASIEPVISIDQSIQMIDKAYRAGCREFKIGLLSGKKPYKAKNVAAMKYYIDKKYGNTCDIYWKDSVTKYIDHDTKAI